MSHEKETETIAKLASLSISLRCLRSFLKDYQNYALNAAMALEQACQLLVAFHAGAEASTTASNAAIALHRNKVNEMQELKETFPALQRLSEQLKGTVKMLADKKQELEAQLFVEGKLSDLASPSAFSSVPTKSKFFGTLFGSSRGRHQRHTAATTVTSPSPSPREMQHIAEDMEKVWNNRFTIVQPVLEYLITTGAKLGKRSVSESLPSFPVPADKKQAPHRYTDSKQTQQKDDTEYDEHLRAEDDFVSEDDREQDLMLSVTSHIPWSQEGSRPVSQQYKILERVGGGAFSFTFKAENITDKTLVAIKKIGCLDLEEANGAINEAIALCKMQTSPCLCRFETVFLEHVDSKLFGVQTMSSSSFSKHFVSPLPSPPASPVSGGSSRSLTSPEHFWKPQHEGESPFAFYVCIVMKFYKDGDLGNVVTAWRQKKLALLRSSRRKSFTSNPSAAVATAADKYAQITTWTLEIAQALKALHAAMIIHRDIKPANVFLEMDESGIMHARLGDLGISKLLHREVQEAMTRTGTPAYMAPEIQEGSRYSYSSDLWSLGCVLYELLTLQPPNFQMRTVHDVLSSVTQACPKVLLNVLEGCLKREPSSRLSAEHVVNLLTASGSSLRTGAAD